jgi:hypothetical protein
MALSDLCDLPVMGAHYSGRIKICGCAVRVMFAFAYSQAAPGVRVDNGHWVLS